MLVGNVTTIPFDDVTYPIKVIWKMFPVAWGCFCSVGAHPFSRNPLDGAPQRTENRWNVDDFPKIL